MRRFDPSKGFALIRDFIVDSLEPNKPLVVAIDDTIVRRAGTNTHGSKWRRDPLGPPFQVNLVRAQRYLQLSAALRLQNGSTRMLPIDLVHAPGRPKSDDPTLTELAVERIHQLRVDLDQNHPHRKLWIVGDASFTNQTVLKNIPERTSLIGRIRKDAKLHYPPAAPRTKGRAKVYGEQAPRPQELLRDESVPWQMCFIKVHGKKVRFRFKTIEGLLSRKAGGNRPLRLIVLAPRHYKKKKAGRYLYKGEAYLICTDPDASIRDILTAYLQRWDIEVDFREQKSLLGLEDAMVRSEASTSLQPAAVAIAYAFLHLAHHLSPRESQEPPKWQKAIAKDRRLPTSRLLNQFRKELWFESIGTFSDFDAQSSADQKQEKLDFPIHSAVLYASSA